MKPSKTPRQLAVNASLLHKHVGELLTSLPELKGYEIRQEYPVKKVNPDFSSGREKFDWVVLGAKIVIECHGEQHYEPVQFGGISEDEAKRKLMEQQDKDEQKRSAAVKMGWTYIIVKYNEIKITAEQLSEKIREALATTVVKKTMASYAEILKKKAPKRVVKAKWPTRKIPSRPFPKKERKNDKTE
jgi:very-short-patch-repair endonuclease